MKERPILFSAPMVRAILDGRKTQTRRVIKPQPSLTPEMDTDAGIAKFYDADECIGSIRCPYGVPGDHLWVREAWQGGWHPHATGNFHLCYENDGSQRFTTAPDDYVLPKVGQNPENTITPLFMPRWASRILLEITDVRVQRVQEISEEDAEEEGAPYCETCGGSNTNFLGNDTCPRNCGQLSYREEFQILWDSINLKRGYGWDTNPWVWAVTFKPIDARRVA